jgi:hypothetical protein
MRRTIGALAVALLMVPVGAVLAAPADPGAGTNQAAVSLFLQMDGHRLPVMYFAGAIAYDVAEVYGVAGKARCTLATRHRETVMVCSAVGSPVAIEPTDFSMDPLLREAHVAFDQGRWHHIVDWTNDKGFQPDYRADPSGTGVIAVAEAESSGTIFNYDFSQRRDHPFGLLLETASARVTVDGVRVRTAPDGTVHVSLTRPLPQD